MAATAVSTTESEKPRVRRVDRARVLADIRDSTGLDFTRWYSPALATKIGDLLDLVSYLPLALKRIFSTLAVFLLATVIALAGAAPWWVFVPAIAWSLVAGVIVGAVVAVRGMVARGLGHVSDILDLVLQLVGNVLEDLGPRRREVLEGMRAPTYDEIVRGILFAVVLPTMEQVVRQRFRVFGRPLAWAFDRTIARSVEAMLAEEKDDAKKPVDEIVQDASKAHSAFVERTLRARRFTAKVSGTAKRIGTFPLTVAAVVAALLGAAPLAIVAVLVRS